jgi:hypothetical protein
MGQRVAGADDPDLLKRTARAHARIDRRYRHFEVLESCPRRPSFDACRNRRRRASDVYGSKARRAIASAQLCHA